MIAWSERPFRIALVCKSLVKVELKYLTVVLLIDMTDAAAADMAAVSETVNTDVVKPLKFKNAVNDTIKVWALVG